MSKVLLLFLMVWCDAWGQAPVVGAPGLATARMAGGVSGAARAALNEMNGRAGVVFAGHVESVDRRDAQGYVDVRFRVDEAVRGCSKLGSYTVREWAGLWNGGAPRYRAGQRLLMLLHARGPGGMSSPVDGMDGAIPLASTTVGPVADTQGQTAADTGSVAGVTADLRWVMARQMRGVRSVQAQASGAAGAVDGSAAWAGPVTAMPAANTAGSGVVGLAAVLDVLRGGASPGIVHEAR